MASQKDFFNKIKNGALAGWHQYKVLPSIMMAQAALESSWGESGLAKDGNALFGIKAGSSWGGNVYTAKTKEQNADGSWVTITANFRAYSSWDESIADHARLIGESSIYKNIPGDKSASSVANKLRQDGYATDQAYPSKLMNIVNTYNLTAVDEAAFSGAGKDITFDFSGGGSSGSSSVNIGGGKLKGDGVGGGIDGYEQNDPNTSMFRGTSPDVEDDDYPKHRYAGNPFVLRIGDSQFFLPPLSIKTTKQGNIDQKMSIRQKSPIMTKSGYTQQILSIDLMFPGSSNINGYKMDSPIGSKTKYYMDGLRSLLAQFYKNPFLPIRNEYINNFLNIFNVALYNITFTTVDGFPNVIVAHLELLECTVEPFTALPDFMYDRLFVYPLWRWFYQQQLIKTDRYSSTYLKPVPSKMHGKAFFKVLDRDLIEQMKADVIKKNSPNDSKSSKTNSSALGEYALSKMKIGQIMKLMTDWETGGAILQNVSVQVAPFITPFVIDDFEQPAYQFLGGFTKSFTLEYYCTTRSEVLSFQNLFSHLEEMSRDYRYRFVSGFLAIDNEILNLAGIYYGMFTEMSTTTIEGYDDNYLVTIKGMSFDPTLKNDERYSTDGEALNGFNWKSTKNKAFDDVDNLEDKMNRKNGVVYEDAINRVLNTLELYPDLELPTYEAVNEIIPKINSYRKKRKQSQLPYKKLNKPPDGKFCDPDFYFAYPTTKQAYEGLELGATGEKIVNLLMNGSYDEINNQAETDMGFDDAFDVIINGVQDNTWDGTNKRKITKKESIKFSNAKVDYKTPSGQSWGKDNKLPSTDKLVEMMTHDMIKYNHRGRMSRAFPTFLFMIVDEGTWVDGRRLMNTYYTYHAITNIDIVKDKDNPVDLAYVELSNVYGTFDFNPKMSDPRKYKKPTGIKNRLDAIIKNWYFTVDDRVMEERSQLMEHIHLKEGARIHIRLGYGSTADENNIVFNGHIASVNEGEMIQMVCQGDGVELINNMYSIDPKGDSPNEPHNTIQKMLTKRDSEYWFNVSANFEFFDNYLSYYGIEHFGFVESKTKKNDNFWKGIINDHWRIVQQSVYGKLSMNAYDVMKNVYRGEQEPYTGQTDSINPFDGEKNINISTYNRTPWDVGQVLSSFVPEFIFATHPHGFRSTVFFGMPHWLVKYGYVRKSGKDGTHYSHFEELVKPYQQFHVFTTGTDIISNEIQASSEQIKHVAVGIYKFGDGQKAKQSTTVYADRSILKDYQKTMILDTGVWQDLFGPDWLISFTGKYMLKPIMEMPADVSEIFAMIADLPIFGKKGDKTAKKLEKWAKNYRNLVDEDAIFTPGEVQSRTVSIGALQKQMMEMYQGQLVLFGDAAVKPWDIFYLNDVHNLMTGTAQVGKVTHSLSRQRGFTTVIKPDLVVSRTDGRGKRSAVINTLITLGTAVALIGTRKLLTSRFVLKMAQLGIRGSLKGLGGGIAKATPKAIKQARTIRWGKDIFKKSATWVKDGKYGKRALKLLKGNLFLTLMIGGVSEWLKTWFDKETKYNNMIYIYPIWKMGEPFVAGIRGGMHIIPGYVDERYADPYMQGSKISPSGTSLSGTGGTGDAGKDGMQNTTVKHPLKKRTSISSKYGWRMLNGVRDFHNGVDLLPVGYDKRGKALTTPVYACANGKIINCADGKGGFNQGMGNFVMIRSYVKGKPYVFTYMHMQSKDFLNGLGKGKLVKAGQKLGLMGKTGDVYGEEPTHTHFEVAAGTTRLPVGATHSNDFDPIPFFKKYGVTL